MSFKSFSPKSRTVTGNGASQGTVADALRNPADEERTEQTAMASIASFITSGVQVQSLRAVSGEVAGTGVQNLGRGPCVTTYAPGPLLVQPFAGRKCDLTGKKANNGYRVSFSHHRTKHLQHVNLQYKRLWWEEGNRWVRLRLSTKAIKTVEKKGLDAMAKDAGVNLLDFAV